ncbi:MAG TPA: hypothetical protein VG916_12785 [Gemmatimonadaceae bacterium]|nr:hypothetical protein [Gemmatimonadaceae bacterium]
MTTIQAMRRALSGVAAITLTAVLAHAQANPLERPLERTQAIDARWRAWTGCWTPVVASTAPSPSASTVCVLPAMGTSAVEIVSISGAKVVDRMHIDADGADHAVSRDDCTGTQAARWAASGTRVYVKESMRCPGGVARSTSTIMSFDQRYRWLDVRGISAGVNQGVAVMRYEPKLDSAGLPAEVQPALALRGPAANNAVLTASAPLTLGDIADVATAADTGVATTWLVERTRDVSIVLDAKQLTTLADRGVPPAVIDVLVALEYPRNFALNAGTNEPAARPAQPAEPRGRADGFRYGDPYGWSSFYSPWYMDPFYGYGAYGYSPYGYYNPYGYYGYGYYPGGGPIIVVTGGGSGGSTGASHGRVIKGRGYSSGGSSGSSAGRSSSASSSSSGGSSGSSSGGSSGSGGSASSGSSSSGSGRVAVRKPPL